jgi:hypothetical protein
MPLTKVSYSMIDGSAINVLDYGAVGDNITDDTQAFKDAIAALNAGNVTEVLYIPAKNYRLTENIVFPTFSKTITVYAYGAVLNFSGLPTNQTAISSNGIVNVFAQTFRWFGGLINGPSITGTNYGLVLQTDTTYMFNTTFNDVVIQNFATGLYCAAVAYTNFTNCFFSNNGNNVLIDNAPAGGGAGNISFINCKILQSKNTHGVIINGGPQNSFENCQLTGNKGYAIALAPNSLNSYIEDTLITNCLFENNDLGSVYFTGGPDVSKNTWNTTLTNNVFRAAENIQSDSTAKHYGFYFCNNYFFASTLNLNNTFYNPIVVNNTLLGTGVSIVNTAIYDANNFLPQQESSITYNSYARYHKFGVQMFTFLTSDTGSPQGRYTSNVGSLYTRTDGGAGTTLYVKESGTGNTGWVAK